MGAVAYLRMSGRWLEQLGFVRGARVLVTAEHGKLVVTLAPPPATKEATQVRRPRLRKLTPYLALASVQRRREFADASRRPKPTEDGRGCDRPD
jgi:hypothetical protein